MKERSGRRSFITNVGIGGVGAAILPAGTTLPGRSTNDFNAQVNGSLGQ